MVEGEKTKKLTAPTKGDEIEKGSSRSGSSTFGGRHGPEANSQEVNEMRWENEQLKALVAELNVKKHIFNQNHYIICLICGLQMSRKYVLACKTTNDQIFGRIIRIFQN